MGTAYRNMVKKTQCTRVLLINMDPGTEPGYKIRKPPAYYIKLKSKFKFYSFIFFTNSEEYSLWVRS